MRFNTAPIVALPQIILRPIDQSDVPSWYEYLALPQTVEHTSWNLKSAEDLYPLVKSYNSDDPASNIRFAVQTTPEQP